MGEVVNVVVAFAVIILVVRWATTSSGESTAEQAAARALRFRPKKVTPEMVETVTGMFPDIPQFVHPTHEGERLTLSSIVPIFTTIFSAPVRSNSRPTRFSSAVFLTHLQKLISRSIRANLVQM